MASFDEVGFLSDEMEDWKRAAPHIQKRLNTPTEQTGWPHAS
jgi:hypothetical protein